jgi:hypothetical protein
VTATEIIDRVKSDIQQVGLTGFYTDAQFLALLNEGLHDFTRRVEPRETTVTQAVASYQIRIELPSNFLEMRQVRWGANTQLIPYSERQLDEEQDGWISRVDTEPIKYTQVSWNVIRIYPIPSAAGTLTLRYARELPELTLTDEPDLPQVWHEAMIYYTEAMAFYGMREYANAAEAWGEYLRRSASAKAKAHVGSRTSDTFVTQRPMDVLNELFWRRGQRRDGRGAV